MRIPNTTITRWGLGSSSNIYREDGNIGIGMSTPNEKLTIAAGAISVQEIATPDATAGYYKIYIGTDGALHILDPSGDDFNIPTAAIENQRWEDSSEQRQDLRDAADGYQSQITGLDTTESEHHSQHSDAIQTILKDLDGYDILPPVASAADGYIAFFTGSTGIAGDNDLYWDRENNQLQLNAGTRLSAPADGALLITENAATQGAQLYASAADTLMLRTMAGATNPTLDMQTGGTLRFGSLNHRVFQSTSKTYMYGTGIGLIQSLDASSDGWAIVTIDSLAAAEMVAPSGTQYGINLNTEIAQTGTAAFKAFKIDVEDTTSGSGQDYLADWQWDSTTKFSVTDEGVLSLFNGTDESNLLNLSHDGTDGYIWTASGNVKISSAGSNVLLTNSAGDDFGYLQMGGATKLSAPSDGALLITDDGATKGAQLHAGQANALTLRTMAGISGATLYINSSQHSITTSGDYLVLATRIGIIVQQKLDTGADGAAILRVNSAAGIEMTASIAGRIQYGINLNPKIAQTNSAIFKAFKIDVDVTSSGGAQDYLADWQWDSTTRFTVTDEGVLSLFNGTDESNSLNLAHDGTDGYIYSGNGDVKIASQGSNVLLTNSAGDDFGLLQLGGTTSSFPAIKRDGTTIQTRLADDSGYATLATGPISANGNITFSATNGPSVINETSSDANPTFCPYGTANSGLGGVYTRVVLVSNATAILSVEKYGFAGSSVKIDGTTFANSTTDDNILDIIGTLNGTGASGGSDIFSALNIDITTTDTTEWDEVNLLRLREDNSDRFRVSMDGDIIVGGLIQLGGTTNAYPAIKRVEDKISIRTADDAYGITNTGALEVNYTEIDAASYTTLKTDHTIGVIRTIDGACAITLGSICVFPGHQLTIIDAGGNCNANNITVDTEGTENINGLATFTMDADYESIQLISTGVDWLITSIT